MSKFIKQMEMASLKNTFKDVRDLAFLSVKGLAVQGGEAALRSTLRKKKIRLKVVKNSLARRVFSELGLGIGPESKYWEGPTMLAWGPSSVSELCQEIDKELKVPKTAKLFAEKITRKGAVADGQEVSWDTASKMPTRTQAIGEIIGMILGAGASIAGCLVGPGNQIAAQVQQVSEKTGEGEKAGEPAAAPAEGGTA